MTGGEPGSSLGHEGGIRVLATEWTFGSVLWTMIVFFFLDDGHLDLHRLVRRHLPA
jgi:hypothetical protein